MIHIATVHWKTERWIPVQEAFLRRHLKSDYRIYAWLNYIPNAPRDSFHYVCTEAVDSHPIKLNILADIILASAKSDDDLLLFLDGDAFPVTDITPLIQENLPARKLIAVQRLENSGDIQPHPCFCVTTVGFWREIRGDWNDGYLWKNARGKQVTDAGGNLMKQLNDRGVEWLPLLRSNRVNLHPLFFALYGGVVYHHGAGFRKGECRVDDANLKLSPRDTFLGKFVPGYRRRVRKKLWKQTIANNDQLSEEIFQQICRDPQFHLQFE